MRCFVGGIRKPNPFDMLEFKIIGKIIKTYKAKLALTYTLFSIEMLGSLLRPFFLGLAINDLIKGSYWGLVYLSVCHLAWLTVGTIRHMYDTRTYSAIYTSLVTSFLNRKFASADVSKLSAHSTLSREIVDFLEADFPYIIEAVYNILGSLVLLYFYEKTVVMICFIILIPVLIISFFYGKKMRYLTQNKNDQLENEVNIISNGNKDSINNHYKQLRKWQIKISDKEAWNFGIMEILVLIIIGTSLLVSTSFLGTSVLAGTMIGMYNYLLRFVSGLDTIPYIVQRYSSIKDIASRIEIKEEDVVADFALI